MMESPSEAPMQLKPVNALLAAALSYLGRGWSVIPLCPPDHKLNLSEHKRTCKRPGKAPIGEWEQYQETLPRERDLRLAWTRHPSCNIGVCLGPVSGLIGLDIDGAA